MGLCRSCLNSTLQALAREGLSKRQSLQKEWALPVILVSEVIEGNNLKNTTMNLVCIVQSKKKRRNR